MSAVNEGGRTGPPAAKSVPPPSAGAGAAWLTTAFWLFVAAFSYLSIGIVEWWTWLLPAGAALAGYRWWHRGYRGRFPSAAGMTCLAVAAAAVSVSAWAVFAPVAVPVDSVGPRRVECGSVLDPVPESELTVTGSPTVSEDRPIPRSSLAWVCGNELDYRGVRAIVVTVVGLLIAARGIGHLRPRRALTKT